MAEPLAYLNGEFKPLPQVHLGINDAGFIWGAAITDLCRTFRHQLFHLEAHLVRFRESCRLAYVPLEVDDDHLAFVAQELVRHNSKLIAAEHDLILCMFATPGELVPTLCMHTYPLPFGRYVGLIREGAHLAISESRRAPSRAISPNIKHRSRLHWWIAQAEARRQNPQAIPLLEGPTGFLTETPTANFLMVREEKVLSPQRDDILCGISLDVVEELCRETGIRFEETNFLWKDIFSAEEAMLCSTPFCLAPVSRINAKQLQWPGPIFQQLITAWNRKVGLDIWGQICACASLG